MKYIENNTDNWKKNINQVTSYFVEEGPGRDSEIMKDCNVKCLDFFFFVFLMEVEKSQST